MEALQVRTKEQKITLLEYLKSNIAYARYWVEVCYEDDCPAFRDVARGYLDEALRVSKEMKLDGVLEKLGRAKGALVVGSIRDTDDALMEAINELEVIIYDVASH